MVAETKVVYDGVDLESVKKVETSEETHGQELDRTSTIFYAGGLAKSKGVFVLLKSFLKLSQRYRDSALILAGGGIQKNEVLRFIEANHLTKCVQVTGLVPRDRLISLMKSSTLVVVPSLLPEAMSRVAVEAMACGKPIVGSNRWCNPRSTRGRGSVS